MRASSICLVAAGLLAAHCKPPRQLEELDVGSTGFYYNPPTVVGGALYVGTSRRVHEAASSENAFFKLDARLKVLWKYPLGTKEVRGAAALDSTGNVYFVVEERSGAQDGPLSLYSLGPDGALRWTQPLMSLAPDLGMSSPAVAADDTVYACGDSLSAFTPAGSVLWSYGTGLGCMNAPIIDPTGNLYFAANPGARAVISVAPSGAERWRYVDSGLPLPAALSSPAFSADSSLVYAGLGESVCRLQASSGALDWCFRPPSAQGEFRATPAVDEAGNAYVGTKANQASVLYAIRADGTGLLWEDPIGADLYSSPALGDDRTLYVGSEIAPSARTRFHAVDMATGREKWSLSLPTDVTWSSPALVPGGTLYIGTMGISDTGENVDGYLYALDADSNGLLPGAGSPRFHGGNASTGRRE